MAKSWRCSITTPFGRPVEPEVYITTATDAGFGAAAAPSLVAALFVLLAWYWRPKLSKSSTVIIVRPLLSCVPLMRGAWQSALGTLSSETMRCVNVGMSSRRFKNSGTW